jgi:hypothetical protein
LYSHAQQNENRQLVLAANICNLLCDLDPSTYDEITPKIEFWIDYVLDERFMTTTDLVDRVSFVAWDSRDSQSGISSSVGSDVLKVKYPYRRCVGK